MVRYRTFLEVYGEWVKSGEHTFRRRQVVVIYEGDSRKRAVETYNSAARTTALDTNVATVGWEVIE